MFSGRRQPSCDGTSRMTRECQVRICERLGGEIPRADSANSAVPRAVGRMSAYPPKLTVKADVPVRQLSARNGHSGRPLVARRRTHLLRSPRSSIRTSTLLSPS